MMSGVLTIGLYPSLGIIGGMGPGSTVRYLDKLFKSFQFRLGAIKNSDFPRVTLVTLPRTDHVSNLADQGFVMDLDAQIEVLLHAGSDVIVAVCNTAHASLSRMDTHQKLLSIVDAVECFHPDRLTDRTVLVLGTRQTILSGIYLGVLQRCRTVALTLKDEDQITLDRLILRVNGGYHSPSDSEAARSIIARYTFDTILLACTELSGFDWGEKTIVDSLDALVEATFRRLTAGTSL